MRRVGFEPTRPCGQGLLRASRLPFRHRREREPSVCEPAHLTGTTDAARAGERRGAAYPPASAAGSIIRSRGMRRGLGVDIGAQLALLVLHVPALAEAAHGE